MAAVTVSVPRPRVVHVEPVMGTMFSFDVRDPGDWRDAIGEAVDWLHHVDAVFSTYRADSDVSRLQRTEIQVSEANTDVTAVLRLCADVRRTTGGFFTERYADRVDPTGLVKGWAIERAAALLRDRGARNFAIDGGGDVQLSGEAAYGRPWSTGISDPADASRICAVVTGRDLAVATSGTAERGPHIIDPASGRPADHFASTTVVGPSLTLADAYATATFAMGMPAFDWIRQVEGYELLVVTRSGKLMVSDNWPAAI